MKCEIQITRILKLLLALAAFSPPLILAQGSSQMDPDPALKCLESVLAEDRYIAFYSDTVLSPGTLNEASDVIFVNCNGVVDCRLDGSVIILNGELSLRAQAEVAGDVVLVRSNMFKSRKAVVAGEVLRTSSEESLKLVRERMNSRKLRRNLPFRVRLKTNRMGGFALEGYDRVDGFSVSWGMDLKFPDLGDFTFFKAKIITATTRQAVGFDATYQLPLDRQGRYIVGVRARSKTDTNDRWRLGDLENAFKAFIAGYDNRFYFRREGYSVYFRRNVGNHSYLSLGYQNEQYFSLKNLSPFTMFGSENFQPNLPVSSGPLRSLLLEGVLDTRNDPFFTLSGFQLEMQGELAGGALGGKWSFARIDLSLKRWDTFSGIHHTFFWVKWAWADQPLPFQRSYTLGNTLRGYDNFAFSGDRMLMAQALYGLSLPGIPVVEYLFFRWRSELIYETGIAFFHGDPRLGYDSLKHDLGVGFSGDTIIGRVGIHLFYSIDEPSRIGPKITVTLNMNVFD